jgi:hypothetical protein
MNYYCSIKYLGTPRDYILVTNYILGGVAFSAHRPQSIAALPPQPLVQSNTYKIVFYITIENKEFTENRELLKKGKMGKLHFPPQFKFRN